MKVGDALFEISKMSSIINSSDRAKLCTSSKLSRWDRFKSLSSVNSVIPIIPFIGVLATSMSTFHYYLLTRFPRLRRRPQKK